MPLTVLSDNNVKELLNGLTKADVKELQLSMRNTLHEYATGTTNSGACAENQPERTVIESNNGTTTLFMPSTSSSGLGIKVVTLSTPRSYSSNETPMPGTPESENTTPQGALTVMGADGKPEGFMNAEEVTAFRTALASSLLMNHRTKMKTIIVFGCGKQAYWHVRLALLLRGSTIRKVHFINREFNERAARIMSHFVSYDAATKKKEGWSDTTFDLTSLNYHEIDRILKDKVRRSDMIICTTPSTTPLFDHTILTSTEGRRRPRLIIAIGSYKPNMIEIPPEVIAQAIKLHGPGMHYHKRAEEGGVIVVDTLACIREAGELVQGGVKSTQTVELGELVMLEQMDPVTPDEVSTPALDDSPRRSSEILSPSSPLSPDGVRSLAKAFRDQNLSSDSYSISSSATNSKNVSRKSSFSLSRKSSFSLKATGRSTSMVSLKRKKMQTEKEDQMSRWLSGGNVVYKSVGMGLMDLVVGADLVRLAREKGVGVTVQDF